VNELLIYAIMLDSVIVAYIQFMIMLRELKKVLSQELNFFLYNNTTMFLSEWTVPKIVDLWLLHFYCIRNK